MPIHRATLIPADHLSPEELLVYEPQSLEKGLPYAYPLQLLRRRGYWATTLPPQLWGLSEVSFAEEGDLRWKAERARKEASLAYGYVRGRDCFEKHGRWFYRDSAISALRDQFAVPSLAIAIVHLLHAAEHDAERVKNREPPIITRTKSPSASKYTPPEDRFVSLYSDRRHRGPTWTPEHDNVLRKWFSRHLYGPHRGQHAPLTPAMWETVLKELDGKRTKTEVRRRILTLNQELRASLTQNGYVPRVNVDRYLREALGERNPRLPHRREPLKPDRKST